MTDEDVKKICEAAAATGSLPAQMYHIREVDAQDALRRLEELAAELNKNPPVSRATVAPVGWICPKCGAVNSPATPQCPCVPPRITCYNT